MGDRDSPAHLENDPAPELTAWEVLERAALDMGFPRDQVDPLLAELRSLNSMLKGSRRRLADMLAPGYLASLTEVLREARALILEAASGKLQVEKVLSPEEARLETEACWEALKASSAEDRRMLVEELEEFQTLALYERVHRESIDAAAGDPALAQELAELARAIADRLPDEAALGLPRT